MKKFLFFSTILISHNLFLFGAVENIAVSDNLIFTPDTSITETLEPTDYGLNLEDFSLADIQTTRFERSTENKYTIGFLTNIRRKSYYGAESGFSIYPLVEAKYNNFFIKPVTLDTVPGYLGGYNFYSDNQFVVAAITEYQLSEQKSSELTSPYSGFVPSKNSEFYFGLAGKFIPESNPDFMLAIEASKNFLNSGGSKIKVYGERYIGLTPDLQLVPAMSYTFLDKSYVNYFYGVPKNSYGPAYLNTSGNKFGAHLDLIYRLGENISFRSINSLEIFSNEISQSPIVANNINLNIGLGLTLDF